jgi:hypothetical protein
MARRLSGSSSATRISSDMLPSRIACIAVRDAARSAAPFDP